MPASHGVERLREKEGGTLSLSKLTGEGERTPNKTTAKNSIIYSLLRRIQLIHLTKILRNHEISWCKVISHLKLLIPSHFSCPDMPNSVCKSVGVKNIWFGKPYGIVPFSAAQYSLFHLPCIIRKTWKISCYPILLLVKRLQSNVNCLSALITVYR